ncbi:MAG: rRNA maturation RNase YbeY [Robiginitomaculum sp.]|nr:rRNA maturation RNase YbeY [Robiginitomaculum sp.]
MKPNPYDGLIDLNISEQKWAKQINNISEVLETSLHALWQVIPDQPKTDICVLLTDDAQMQELNQQYRGKSRPTNVLSFPTADFHGSHLGDVALGYETCMQEITDKGISLEEHLCHLFVHGVLHLVGFSHQEQLEATEMEQLESRILLNLDRPDPWAKEANK